MSCSTAIILGIQNGRDSLNAILRRMQPPTPGPCRSPSKATRVELTKSSWIATRLRALCLLGGKCMINSIANTETTTTGHTHAYSKVVALQTSPKLSRYPALPLLHYTARKSNRRCKCELVNFIHGGRTCANEKAKGRNMSQVRGRFSQGLSLPEGCISTVRVSLER